MCSALSRAWIARTGVAVAVDYDALCQSGPDNSDYGELYSRGLKSSMTFWHGYNEPEVWGDLVQYACVFGSCFEDFLVFSVLLCCVFPGKPPIDLGFAFEACVLNGEYYGRRAPG